MVEFNLTLKDAATFSIVKLVDAIEGIPETSVWVGVRGERGQHLVNYATVNEYGSADGRVPERSFLRRTVDNYGSQYADELESYLDAQLAGDAQQAEQRLNMLGVRAVSDVQMTITELRHPPNAPSTIRRKGSANPLMDTGRLRQGIDYEVRTELVELGDQLQRVAEVLT